LVLRDVLQQLKQTEEKRGRTARAAGARSKLLEHHREAFVENLDGDQLFNAMFENDAVGKTLLALGDAARDVHNTYPFLTTPGQVATKLLHISLYFQTPPPPKFFLPSR
jgi:hypothetical protein